jgi:hypothetical protein
MITVRPAVFEPDRRAQRGDSVQVGVHLGLKFLGSAPMDAPPSYPAGR